jgi:hypothetical protein
MRAWVAACLVAAALAGCDAILGIQSHELAPGSSEGGADGGGALHVTGGIRSTGVAAGDAGIRLVAGGFELGTRTCNDAGVCVTGGIVP